MAGKTGVTTPRKSVYYAVAQDCDTFAEQIESGEIENHWRLAGALGAGSGGKHSGGSGASATFGFGQQSTASDFAAPKDLAAAYGKRHGETGDELKALAASLRALANVLRHTADSYQKAGYAEDDDVQHIRQMMPKLPTIA
jgi:hypothetical protein